MIELARGRTASNEVAAKDRRFFERFSKLEFQQTICALPKEAQEHMARRAMPEISNDALSLLLAHWKELREEDPLVLLRDDLFGKNSKGGQLSTIQVVPNFELLLLIAQATGALIVTDNHTRWTELRAASRPDDSWSASRIPILAEKIQTSDYCLVDDLIDALKLLDSSKMRAHQGSVNDLYSRLMNKTPNLDTASIVEQFENAIAVSGAEICKIAENPIKASMRYIAPVNGIYHDHVARLMIKCGIEDRFDRALLAVLIDVHDEQQQVS